MYHYGIRGISQKWIQSYLSHRKHKKQHVEYGQVKSDCKDIVCRIPQDLKNTDCQRQWAKCNRKPVAPSGVKV